MLGNFSVSVSMQKKKWLQVFGGKEKMVWGNSIDDFAKENKLGSSFLSRTFMIGAGCWHE